MDTEVKCPYCEKFIEIHPDEHCEDTEIYECPNCQKNFEVLAEVSINYESLGKADCLNGGEHQWKQIVGCPEFHFKGKYRCKNCSETKTVTEELATKEDRDEYFLSD